MVDTVDAGAAQRCFERGVQAGDGNDSLIMKMHVRSATRCRAPITRVHTHTHTLFVLPLHDVGAFTLHAT